MAEQTIAPVSVIMPSCNPPLETIQAALQALQAQTLPLDQWELLLVDNNSQPPLAEALDLSWHPKARYISELTPGAQHARARGLRESHGELIVNVDDDNILAPDYLATALRLARERPHLGVWGGCIAGAFEEVPPPWVHAYKHHLAIIEFSESRWSSFVDDSSMPYGAGMCMRRSVVEAYLERLKVENITRFNRNDRGASTNFVAGEDQFIVYTACLIGLAVGRFSELRMRHRIPRKRFDPPYFLKLVRGNAHGALLVRLYHRNCVSHRSRLVWPILKYLFVCLRYRGMQRRVLCAEARGAFDALLEARRHPQEVTPLPAAIITPREPSAMLPSLSKRSIAP